MNAGRSRLLVSCLLVVLLAAGGVLLLTGPVDAQAQPESVFVQQDAVAADEIRITVTLHEDGSATWSLGFWRVLDDEDSRAAFESLQRDIESDPAQERSLSISPNTAVAPAPLRDRTLDPPTRGWVRVNGTPLFRGGNTEYAEQFLRYMYEGPQRQADKNNVTMRSLPPYEEILETDEYRSTEIYQAEDGYFLDLERQLLDKVLPLHAGTRPRTPAARYAMQRMPPDTTAEWQDADPDILTELVQAVLVDGKSMDEEIEGASQRLQLRLEDGRELSG